MEQIKEKKEDIDIYFKQANLFNPKENNLKVFVYGAGSIGSHIIMNLAKMGIEDITVYDYDTVEKSNIPAQFYKKSDGDLKLKKIIAIKNNVKEFTNIDINVVDTKIDEKFNPNYDNNSIHILAFDNIEARKMIFDKLKGFPLVLIDGRIGSFNYEKYSICCDNKEDVSYYETTLQGEFTELSCGDKALWGVNAMISSLICSDVIRWNKSKKLDDISVKGNLLSNILLIKRRQNGILL